MRTATAAWFMILNKLITITLAFYLLRPLKSKISI